MSRLVWITARVGHCPMRMREELSRPSGYSYYKLLGHFWSLILTSGTRPLRVITVMGLGSMVLALAIAAFALYGKFTVRCRSRGGLRS